MAVSSSMPTDAGAATHSPCDDVPHYPDSDIWQRLRLHTTQERAPVKNANDLQQSELKPLDRLAVAITDRVGSMG